MFNLRDGLCIERLHNGDVRIIKYEAPGSPERFEITVPPNEFASFICNGSKHQENYGQFFAAMNLLGVPGYEKGWEDYQSQLKAAGISE